MDTSSQRGGNFYAEPHAYSVSFKDGVLKNRYGRRYIALTETFLSGFLEGLEIECGEAADEVLYTCGWEYGEVHARHMDEDLSRYYGGSSRRFPMAKFNALLHEGLSHDGWGHLTMDYTTHDNGILVAEVKNAVYSSVVRGRGRNADSLLAGFLAGVFSYFAETRLDALQTGAPLAVEQGSPLASQGPSTFVITTMERLDDVRELLDDGQGHAQVVQQLTGAAARA